MDQFDRIQKEELYHADIGKQLEPTPTHQPIGVQASANQNYSFGFVCGALT